MASSDLSHKVWLISLWFPGFDGPGRLRMLNRILLRKNRSHLPCLSDPQWKTNWVDGWATIEYIGVIVNAGQLFDIVRDFFDDGSVVMQLKLLRVEPNAMASWFEENDAEKTKTRSKRRRGRGS